MGDKDSELLEAKRAVNALQDQVKLELRFEIELNGFLSEELKLYGVFINCFFDDQNK